MQENSTFDINRVKLLLIRQLRFSTQPLLIGFGAVIGLLVFILSMRIIFGGTNLSSTVFFGVIMPFFYVGGYIFTSTIFSELGTPQRGYMYIILPASTFEKLAVSWFITSFMYVAASIVVMFLINMFLVIISSLFSLSIVPFINLFDPTILKIYATYLVAQPIFILGAIYFKKSNFLKTVLSIILIGLAIGIFTAIAAKIIVFPHTFHMEFNDHNMPENVNNFFVNIFAPTMKVIFWCFMAPFFLTVSYFRLKEREV